MKKLAILILSFISFRAYAQDKDVDLTVSPYRDFQFGVNISPDISYRALKNREGSASGDALLNRRNENETYKIGYTAGIKLNYSFTDHFSLEGGIQYSNKGYYRKYDTMVDIRDLGFKKEDEITLRLRDYYLDIPLKINYITGRHKVRFITSLGVTTNFFLVQVTDIVKVTPSGEVIHYFGPNADYNLLDISPTASVGIDYKYNERINLRIEPAFRFGLLKVNNSPVATYLYNAGLNIGYYHRL